jgi:hypothetical protein
MKFIKEGDITDVIKISATAGYVVLTISLGSLGQGMSTTLTIPHEHIDVFVERLKLARDAAAIMEGAAKTDQGGGSG